MTYNIRCPQHQAWELRMEKSAEKWGPQKAPSGGPEGSAPGGGKGAKPPEAFKQK